MHLEPESDLSLNILVVSTDIISILSKNKNEGILVDNLLRRFTAKDIKRTPELFFDCLTFLFAIGFINEENSKIRLSGAQK